MRSARVLGSPILILLVAYTVGNVAVTSLIALLLQRFGASKELMKLSSLVAWYVFRLGVFVPLGFAVARRGPYVALRLALWAGVLGSLVLLLPDIAAGILFAPRQSPAGTVDSAKYVMLPLVGTMVAQILLSLLGAILASHHVAGGQREQGAAS